MRGWCESSNCTRPPEGSKDQKMLQYTPRNKLKQNESILKKEYQKSDRFTLWFEVDDTGCGKQLFSACWPSPSDW